MPFGGGGAGGLITAHVHDNNIGQGGSLDGSLTLIDDDNLLGTVVALS